MIKAFLKLIFGRGSFRSFSQAGEDGILRALFRQQTGFYVDVGAYHPHLYSNTYALYRAGWQGIVIDPNPNLKSLFKIFRSRDEFMGAGIGQGTQTYYSYQDEAFNGFRLVKDSPLVATRTVELKSLTQILAGRGLKKIDLLDIDVEGMDLEVLRSYDWSILPTVILVEAPPGSPVQAFLEAKGYKLVSFTPHNLILKLA